MVIQKNLPTAFLLYLMMPHLCAPTNDRFLVAPTGKRQNPALARKATVADIIDETVHSLQLRPKHLGIAQIGVPLIRFRVNLKKNRKHKCLHTGSFYSG